MAGDRSPLSLGTQFHDLEVKTVGNAWELTVTGRDPWIWTSPFPKRPLSETPIFGCEVQSTQTVAWTVYAMGEAGAEMRPGETPQSSGFIPFSMSLRVYDGPKTQAMKAVRLRLGFGGEVGKVVVLRNLHLRKAGPEDLRMEEEWNRKRAAEKPREVFLANEQCRIGIDLNMGGAITHFGSSDGENLINVHDQGREIQQSYYAGPNPFGVPHPRWKNWGWNPIGAGDAYGNRSRVVEVRHDKEHLYVKTVPLQWALQNVPGECFFETWIALEHNTASVRCKLTNLRPDKTQYPAKDQELPALYTVGTQWRLMSYTGNAPFTGGEVTEIDTVTQAGEFRWKRFAATEGWAALASDGGKAVGLILPGAVRWLGGFDGSRNKGGPRDASTGYLAPIHREVLDHNIEYEYVYTLMLGTVEQVRAKASELHSHKGFEAIFEKDRRHWVFEKTSDQGWPVPGRLVLDAGDSNAALRSPLLNCASGAFERVVVTAEHHLSRTNERRMELLWIPELASSPDRAGPVRATAEIIADGRKHDYVFDLSELKGAAGTGVFKLRFAGGEGAVPGDKVEVFSVTLP
jgi:hypothetical protein